MIGIVLMGVTPAFAATEAALTIVQTPARLTVSVPQGAQRVPMASMALTASCAGDVTISAIKVRHEGLGGEEEIRGLYAVDIKGKRMTNAVTFQGTPPKATVRFRTFTIPQCTTVTINLLADITDNAKAGSEHRVSITATNDVESTAETVAVQSSAGRTSTVRLAPATNGVISVKYPSIPVALRFGADRVVARLQLTANGEEDHLIDSITLTNQGKARNGHLQNLTVQTSAEVTLSDEVAQLDGDSVTFHFSPPLLLERNQTRLLNVHADVRAGVKLTVKLMVEEPSDLAAHARKQRNEKFQ